MPDQHSAGDEWEELDVQDHATKKSGGACVTSRLRVPGGWLYRSLVSNTIGLATSLAFVPDAEAD